MVEQNVSDAPVADLLTKEEAEERKSDSLLFLESLKRKLETSVDGSSDHSRKSKRNKLLIPSVVSAVFELDREAYYAVVSLLIDKTLIPEDLKCTRLTASDCEKYIPPKDMIVLEILKEVLRYDCE